MANGEPHSSARRGTSRHSVPVGSGSKKMSFNLEITLSTTPVSCLIARKDRPHDLGANLEKALKTKLPKLVKTTATKRILLVEMDQFCLSDSREIVLLGPCLSRTLLRSTRSGLSTLRPSRRMPGQASN